MAGKIITITSLVNQEFAISGKNVICALLQTILWWTVASVSQAVRQESSVDPGSAKETNLHPI